MRASSLMGESFFLSFVVVCCFLLSKGVDTQTTTTTNNPFTSSVDCPYQHLPQDFDSISYLGANGEFHSFGTYYFDFVSPYYNIMFSVQNRTAFRAYFAPHVVDIDMYLYHLQDDGTYDIITFTFDALVGGDEAILATINAGTYKLTLFFYGITQMVGVDCPTLSMEVEMVPTPTLSQRVSQFSCPPATLLPVLNISSITTQNHFYYDSDINDTSVVFNVRDVGGEQFNFLKKYTLALPVDSTGGVWVLEVTLGTHFLTGGSLGLLLLDSPSTPTDKSCLAKDNCTLGVHNARGQNTIKQLLSPGTYDLWIFDEVSEKNFSLSTCNPFSLKVDIQQAQKKENFLSCPYEELPGNFNSTGYIDNDGFMYFRQHLLANLAVTSRLVYFRLAEVSYFRAYTADHRIDIDLYLYNDDTNQVVAYTLQWGGEEGLTAYLQPYINYRLDINFFGSYTHVFCESYLLEVAISPASLYSNISLCSYTKNTPNLTGIPAALRSANNRNNYVYGAGQVFTFDYNGDYSQRTIVSQTFGITVASYIKAELGVNFLLGDLEVWLTDKNNNLQLGDHRRNLHYLDLLLPIGNYTIAVVTGDTQDNLQVAFPNCTVYTLSIEIAPFTPSTSADCISYRLFPSSLNTPQFLGSSPKVHVQEQFLVPPAQRLATYADVITTFNVSVASYFRIYVSPHIIDIDITLTENGRSVATGNSFNGEEAVAFMLKPRAQYSMTTRYYYWIWNGPFDDPCYTYPAEFAIEPVIGDEARGGQPCTVDNMPTSTFIPTPTTTGFHHEQTYQFSQGAREREFNFLVTVPKGTTALFRAEVVYDFAWNDLSIMLVNANRTSQVVTQGVIGYNREEIPSMLLVQGFYNLRLYEPFATNMPGQILRNCVEFELRLSVQLTSSPYDYATMDLCDDTPFPQTFNSPPFLSNITGSALQFTRNVLVDVVDRADYTDFVVVVPSVLRVYVPRHASVDVDVFLYAGTHTNHVGAPIRSQTGYSEEIIHFLLVPGTYSLLWGYYAFAGGPPLPSADQCVTFPVVITIYPETTLSTVPLVTSTCNNVSPPTQLVGNQLVSGTFTRSLAVWPFHTELVFKVETTVSSFEVDLRYFDAALGLAMVLYGSNVQGVSGSNKVYYPLYEANHAYFNEILFPGSYSLNITDPASYQSTSRDADAAVLKCAVYTLSYFVNSTADLPADACDDTQQLPTQFIPLGDGSIRLFADHLYMTTDQQQRHHYITFNITQLSYMRIFGNAFESDVDFWLYQYDGGDLWTLFQHSAGTDSKESALWVLPPAQYYLDIDYYYVTPAPVCTYWQFEVAIKPNTTVQQELLCPAVLPNEIYQVPNPNVDLRGGSERDSYGNYLFTSARIQSGTNQGTFTYRITIVAGTKPMIILASIGFDFLANDFTLVLSKANNVRLAVGTPDAAANRNSYVNFVNSVGYELVNGTFYLDITQSEQQRFTTGLFCHYFEFQLLAYPSGGPPKVINVNPQYGYDLDPSQDLDLSVIFSESVSLSEAQLGSFLQSSRAIALSNSTHTLLPSYVTTHSGGSILAVTFANPFTAGSVYELVLNASAFTTTQGVGFAPQQYAYNVYVMYLCDCHAKGTCVQLHGTTEWACACNFPWAGTNCDDCVAGYHGAGTTCVQNGVCTNTSCNGHGRCIDMSGYISCTCADGYDSDGVNFCARCASGYSGYPNCTVVDPDMDRPVYCAAPLLPTTLNGPGYLGFNQRTHISGEYYIDLTERQHEVLFTLHNTSVFRVYVEPHWVDIDIWLSVFGRDGRETFITYRTSYNFEESIFLALAAGNYKITFRYYQWETGHDTTCETFLLELAISPTTSTANEASLVKTQYCQTTSVLPPNTPIIVDKPYSYHSVTPFTLNALNRTNGLANYFWSVSITIVPGDKQVASLTATLGYRFALGDVSLLLEPGISRWHCNNTNTAFFPTSTDCVYSHNDYDTTSIHEYLRAGNYTLWIYEPVPQNASLSTCAVFDYTLDITFLDEDTDVFDCDGTPVPTSLDSVDYTLPDGSIHFTDRFLLNDALDPHTTFTVTQPSLFRVAVSTSSSSDSAGDVSLQLRNTTAVVGLQSDNSGGDLYASVGPGIYTLHFASNSISASDCPIVYIELAVVRASYITPLSCPPATTYPNFPPVIPIPYYYGPARGTTGTTAGATDVVFYALYSPDRLVFASYTFTVTSQLVVLEATLSSNFAQFDLRLTLLRGATVFAAGVHDYNMVEIRKELSEGTYTLQLSHPPVGNTPPTPLSTCAPYTFMFYVANAPSQVCAGDILPSSFNTPRFLDAENNDTLNYQSSDFMVPHNITTLFKAQYTSIVVHSERMLRVYVEPHVVDIDVALLLNSTGQVVAQGSNGVGPEETFTYILSPNVAYIFLVRFWIWHPEQILQCNSFNMEIAVGAVTPLTPVCPNNGGNNWIPAIPNSLPTTTPYSYDSVAASQDLYFQQSTVKAASFSTTFALTASADFHAQIGYDFLRGDVVLKLTTTTTGDEYYGDNRPNRNVLNVANLPPATYTLTIYEPTVTEQRVIGCAHFTFEIFIQIAAVTQINTHYLPASLDAIAYALLDGRTHIAGVYTLWDNNNSNNNNNNNNNNNAHNKITFKVTQNSILRVAASVSDDEDIVSTVTDSILSPLIKLSTLSQRSVTSGFGGFLQLVVPDTYTLEFVATQAMAISPDGLGLEVELAIDTVSHVQGDITQSSSTTCTTSDPAFTPIVPNPYGHFQDQATFTISYATLSSSDVINSLPFTLTRNTRIYVQISSQFLTSDLMLVLNSTDAKIWIFGRQGRNIDEINAEVPPGSYTLQIIQYPTGLFTPEMGLPHCGMFEYTIVVADATGSGDIACATYDLLPWTLDDVNIGNSQPYGGPIDASGSLHLYGPSFYIPHHAQDTVTFNITTPSIVSVLTLAPDSDIDYLLTTNSGNTTISPMQTTSPYGGERIALMFVNSTGVPAHTYALDLIYRRRSFLRCPTFALQINIKPVSVLKNLLACPTTPVDTPVTLTIDTQGFASNYVSSYVVSTSNNNNRVVSFNLTKTSHVTTSLAFNSLATTFAVAIYRRVNNVDSLYESCDYEGQAENSGLTTVSQACAADLMAGSYSIRITTLTYNGAAPLLATQLCFPFIWSASIIPVVGFPYVSVVTPSNAVDINPYAAFSFSVVFSVVLQSAFGIPISSPLVQSAFFLAGSNGVNVYPTSAVSLNDVNEWRLTFPSGVLANATTYRLKLSPVLVDSQFNALYLPDTYVYTTADTKCSNNGVYDTTRGVCVCNTAYAGIMCLSCNAGFTDVSTTSRPVCVVQPCLENTCGCDTTFPRSCVPLGVCTYNSMGYPVCDCTTGYNSTTYCGSCAAGYMGFPQCRAVCDVLAVTGRVATTDATCYNNSDAVIAIVPETGTPPYTVTLSRGDVLPTTGQRVSFTGVSSGTYSAVIRDSNGCSVQLPNIVVNQPAVIVVSVTATNVTSYGRNDGSATASASGGVPPYSYQWLSPVSSTSPHVSNLSPGVYTVIVTDSHSCTKTSYISISQPAGTTATTSSSTTKSPSTTSATTASTTSATTAAATSATTAAATSATTASTTSATTAATTASTTSATTASTTSATTSASTSATTSTTATPTTASTSTTSTTKTPTTQSPSTSTTTTSTTAATTATTTKTTTSASSYSGSSISSTSSTTGTLPDTNKQPNSVVGVAVGVSVAVVVLAGGAVAAVFYIRKRRERTGGHKYERPPLMEHADNDDEL